MLVMYSKDNSWEIASDNIFETTDIDSVDFADLTGNGKAEIIVNSTTYTPNVGKLLLLLLGRQTTTEVGCQNKTVQALLQMTMTEQARLCRLYTTETEALALNT